MSSIETIKRSLRNYLPTSVNIDDFIKAEMTLALKMQGQGDPTKAYLLFHNCNIAFGRGSFAMKLLFCFKKLTDFTFLQFKDLSGKGSENYCNAQPEFCFPIFLQQSKRAVRS